VDTDVTDALLILALVLGLPILMFISWVFGAPSGIQPGDPDWDPAWDEEE
jgi:hypothetical protein